MSRVSPSGMGPLACQEKTGGPEKGLHPGRHPGRPGRPTECWDTESILLLLQCPGFSQLVGSKVGWGWSSSLQVWPSFYSHGKRPGSQSPSRAKPRALAEKHAAAARPWEQGAGGPLRPPSCWEGLSFSPSFSVPSAEKRGFRGRSAFSPTQAALGGWGPVHFQASDWKEEEEETTVTPNLRVTSTGIHDGGKKHFQCKGVSPPWPLCCQPPSVRPAEPRPGKAGCRMEAY